MSVILHTYTRVEASRQMATLLGMIDVAKVYNKSVLNVLIMDDSTYYNHFCKLWRREIIINVERDIEVDAGYVTNLLRCPEPACAYSYRIGEDRHSSLFEMKNGEMHFSKHDPHDIPTTSFGAGIGLAKIGTTIQRKIDIKEYPADKYRWWYIDTWLSERMAASGFRWHIHAPEIRHYDYPQDW